MNVKQLESAAVRAHDRGVCFTEFYETHKDDIRAAEPYDRRRFARLYHRLLHLCIAGNLDGAVPVGDNDTMPWEADDAQGVAMPVVSDVGTATRWQGLPAEVTA